MKKGIPFLIAPVASLMLIISIAGCPRPTPPANGDDNTNVNANGNANENANENGGGGEPAPAGVSFKDDVEPILTPLCGSCHTLNGIADQRGIALRLDGSDNFDALFNGSSIQDSSLKFAVAGDPDNSLVYLKVSRENPPVGARMPLFPIPALSGAEQDLIRQWIEAGAEDN